MDQIATALYFFSALSLGIISALVSKSVTENHCLMEFLVHSPVLCVYIVDAYVIILIFKE